jgi:cytoskeleton protein RodZ
MAKPEMMSAEAARVGEELRDARLALGATLEEVADSLRINRRYLAALEEGRSRDLPGPAYALGFVRSYARALGLDADDMARRYRETGPARSGRTDLIFPEPVPERGIPAGVVILAGVVIMVGAYAAWWQWSGSADRTVDAVPPPPARIEQAARDARPQATPEAAPVLPPTLGQATPGAARPGTAPAQPGVAANTQPPAASLAPTPATSQTPAAASPPGGSSRTGAPPAATAPGQIAAVPPAPVPPPATTPTAPTEPAARITLRATDESWVQVRDPRSGQTVLNRVLRAGESYAVPREGLVLTTGKAQGLEVVVDGQATPALAGRTGVVRDVALVPEQLQQPRTPPAR